MALKLQISEACTRRLAKPGLRVDVLVEFALGKIYGSERKHIEIALNMLIELARTDSSFIPILRRIAQSLEAQAGKSDLAGQAWQAVRDLETAAGSQSPVSSSGAQDAGRAIEIPLPAPDPISVRSDESSPLPPVVPPVAQEEVALAEQRVAAPPQEGLPTASSPATQRTGQPLEPPPSLAPSIIKPSLLQTPLATQMSTGRYITRESVFGDEFIELLRQRNITSEFDLYSSTSQVPFTYRRRRIVVSCPEQPYSESEIRAVLPGILVQVLDIDQEIFARDCCASTSLVRKLCAIERHLKDAKEYRLTSANELAVAEELSKDAAYCDAVSKKDITNALAVAEKYAKLLEVVEGTNAEITRYQYIDVVTNARMIIPVGDVHGDIYGLIDQGLRSGFLVDRGEKHTSLTERYVLNPSLPPGTQVVFMGDLIDRGEYSAEVIALVRAMVDATKARNDGTHVHVLRGNHESIFFRFLDLYPNLTISEVRELLDADMGPLIRNEELSDTVPEKLADLLRAALSQEGIIWYTKFPSTNIGVGQTLESIIKKYNLNENDTLRTAIDRMENDGTLKFMHTMRGAVIIDNLYFTHGGPVMTEPVLTAGSRDNTVHALDNHFTNQFSNSENDLWACTGPFIEGSRVSKLYSLARDTSDLSLEYAEELEKARAKNPDIARKFQEFLSVLRISHIYAGHEKTNRPGDISVRPYGEYVTCVDVSLSTAYGAGDGILILDPIRRHGFATVVRGRNIVNNNKWVEQRPASTVDFSNGRTRLTVLRNRISEAAAKAYGESVAPEIVPPQQASAPLSAPHVLQSTPPALQLIHPAPATPTTAPARPVPAAVPRPAPAAAPATPAPALSPAPAPVAASVLQPRVDIQRWTELNEVSPILAKALTDPSLVSVCTNAFLVILRKANTLEKKTEACNAVIRLAEEVFTNGSEEWEKQRWPILDSLDSLRGLPVQSSSLILRRLVDVAVKCDSAFLFESLYSFYRTVYNFPADRPAYIAALEEIAASNTLRVDKQAANIANQELLKFYYDELIDTLRVRLKFRSLLLPGEIRRRWEEYVMPNYASVLVAEKKKIMLKKAIENTKNERREIILDLPVALLELNGNDTEKRIRAAKLLGRLGTRVSSDIHRQRIQNGLFVQLRKDMPDQRLAVAILDALGRIGDETALNKLLTSMGLFVSSPGNKPRQKVHAGAIKKITARVTRQNAGGSFWRSTDALSCYLPGAAILGSSAYIGASVGGVRGLGIGLLSSVFSTAPSIALKVAYKRYTEKYKPTKGAS